MNEEKIKKLKELEEKVKSCRKCPLFSMRNNVVFGEGNEDADIMFIGEAPGFNEDMTGHPFCGAAGKILDELLKRVGLKRDEIYIANVLKCRPPQNRDPLPEEIKSCSPYLEKQIQIINPKIICTLGNYATKFIMEKYGLKEQIEGISKIHGKVFEVSSLFQEIKVIPLYHPAVATYNPNMRKILEDDFEILRNIK